MKFKNTVKTIFTTYLCILIVCLYASSFIGYTKQPLSSLSSSVINPVIDNQPLDYRILDKNEYLDPYCGEVEYFYEKDGYTYYLPCASSDNIYIEWSNGKITTLLYGIKYDNLDIDNLIINKGLKVYKEKYERN